MMMMMMMMMDEEKRDELREIVIKPRVWSISIKYFYPLAYFAYS